MYPQATAIELLPDRRQGRLETRSIPRPEDRVELTVHAVGFQAPVRDAGADAPECDRQQSLAFLHRLVMG